MPEQRLPTVVFSWRSKIKLWVMIYYIYFFLHWLPCWEWVCIRCIYFFTISQTTGSALVMWKKYSVNFQVSVPIEMQLSNYSTAHFSEFLWALISLRRISWFLALFSSYSFFKHFRISRSISLQWPKNFKMLCSLWHFLSRLITRLHSSVCRWGDRSGCIFS